MSSFVGDVFVNLFAAALGFSGREIYFWIKSRRGPLTGTWRQIIEEDYHREDIVRCKHVGHSVTGTICRDLPLDERGKSWHFAGRQKDDFVFMTFWNDNDKENPESSGTIQLQRFSARDLKGYYVKCLPKSLPCEIGLVKQLTGTTVTGCANPTLDGDEHGWKL